MTFVYSPFSTSFTVAFRLSSLLTSIPGAMIGSFFCGSFLFNTLPPPLALPQKYFRLFGSYFYCFYFVEFLSGQFSISEKGEAYSSTLVSIFTIRVKYQAFEMIINRE